jgi:hypothetical protein
VVLVKPLRYLKPIEEFNLLGKVTKLSARKQNDREYISIITDTSDIGIVLIDDFHKLGDDIQSLLADRVKVLADEERTDSKIIILGISEAGN